MKNENKCKFLITKSEANETLNELEELLNCEIFEKQEQAEQVDGVLKQLGDMDTDTASAIGDLLLAVTSEQAIAKTCDIHNWQKITGIEQREIQCLVKKSELNQVEQFIQRFVTKAEMESTELEVISKALEVISDLDDTSLGAIHSLLKIEFSETTIKKHWPSLFKHTEANQAEDSSQTKAKQPVAKKKSGLKWPTRNSFTGTAQSKPSGRILNPLTGQYREADGNEMSKSDEKKWPSISG